MARKLNPSRQWNPESKLSDYDVSIKLSICSQLFQVISYISLLFQVGIKSHICRERRLHPEDIFFTDLTVCSSTLTD